MTVLAFGVVAVACLDDASPLPTDLPYSGARSACSTGPAYPNDTVFAAGRSSSDQPVCVPRCGTHPTLTWSLATGATGGPSPLIEAVPSGACTYEGEACSMVAVRSCCPGSPGSGLLLECHCVNLAWSCTAALAPGAVECPAASTCTGDDGGTDAGEEADAGAEDAGADAGDAGDAGDASH